MCGRFELHSAFEIIAQVFGLAGGAFAVPGGYNIAPGRDIAVVLGEGGTRHLAACRWGFVPSWARELNEGYKMINARAETVAEKPSFRKAFQQHRCLVVADGFYEWKSEGRNKRPYYIHRKDNRPFGMAGLYNNWVAPDGRTVCTATIITTDANATLKPVHDRMPVIAPAAAYDLWLDPAVSDTEKLLKVLRPFPDRELEMYEVSSLVSSPKHDSAENIKRLGGQ